MTAVHAGRMTHQHTSELVVFLIGMRFNHWWRPDLWLPVLVAMPRMLSELMKDPSQGLLGYRLLLGERGLTVVQYWSSHEKLYDYASDPEATHRPAWRAYNKMARRAAGAVGIWHETYEVAAAESVYVAMPPTGLAKATACVPIGAPMDTARQRYDAGTI